MPEALLGLGKAPLEALQLPPPAPIRARPRRTRSSSACGVPSRSGLAPPTPPRAPDRSAKRGALGFSFVSEVPTTSQPRAPRQWRESSLRPLPPHTPARGHQMPEEGWKGQWAPYQDQLWDVSSSRGKGPIWGLPNSLPWFVCGQVQALPRGTSYRRGGALLLQDSQKSWVSRTRGRSR